MAITTLDEFGDSRLIEVLRAAPAIATAGPL